MNIGHIAMISRWKVTTGAPILSISHDPGGATDPDKKRMSAGKYGTFGY